MEFNKRLINLMNENFNNQAQSLIASDFQNYVNITNPFDQTDYKSLIEEVLKSETLPKGVDRVTRESIQNCFINALVKKGIDPFKEV